MNLPDDGTPSYATRRSALEAVDETGWEIYEDWGGGHLRIPQHPLTQPHQTAAVHATCGASLMLLTADVSRSGAPAWWWHPLTKRQEGTS